VAAPLSSGRGAARAALLAALLLVACTRTVEFVDLRTGSVLTGTRSLWHRSVSVSLPDGETAAGPYTKLTTAEIGPESLFFGANAGELLGRHVVAQVSGYARLVGERGTVVEIIFSSDWLGHGHGVARTSRKEEYRVTF
jgi:hypothetical protein